MLVAASTYKNFFFVCNPAASNVLLCSDTHVINFSFFVSSLCILHKINRIIEAVANILPDMIINAQQSLLRCQDCA